MALSTDDKLYDASTPATKLIVLPDSLVVDVHSYTFFHTEKWQRTQLTAAECVTPMQNVLTCRLLDLMEAACACTGA